MSKDGGSRFRKGQSGNPNGRPKVSRPHISAFDVIFDKTLTINQGGVERELTVDEALQLQTYQAALKGSRMAIHSILKMIEKREVAIAATSVPTAAPIRIEQHHDADNANLAMQILDIAEYGEVLDGGRPETRLFKLKAWAVQAALSQPGRRKLEPRDIADIRRKTVGAEGIKWPRTGIT